MRASLDGRYGTTLVSMLALLALKTSVVSAERSPTPPDVITGLGEVRVVQLAEGILIHLNELSHLQFGEARAARRSMLVTGRCRVELATGAAGAVEIAAGPMVIRAAASGRFDLRHDPQATVVSVLEGTATVKRDTERRIELHLRSGERATYREGAPGISWTDGRLWVEGEPLRDVVAQLNHYNSQRVVIDDPELAQTRISGVFRPTQLDTFLRALAPFGIHAVESSTQPGQPRLVLMSHNR